MMYPTQYDEGLCYCCGQTFIEVTRVRPEAGYSWHQVLGRHSERGVCPLCFNTYGIQQGNEQPWDEGRWRQHHAKTIKTQVSPQELDALADELGVRWPELATQARQRAASFRRHRVNLECLALAGRIRSETDTEELLWLGAALDERSPQLANLARCRAAMLHQKEEMDVVQTKQAKQAVSVHSKRKRPAVWRSVAIMATAVGLTFSAIGWNLHTASSVETMALSAAAATSKTLLERGYDALDARKPLRAMGLFEQLLERNPHSQEAYTGIGYTHMATGRMDRAIGAFETVTALDPTRGHLPLARLYRMSDDPANALHHYNQFLAHQPTHTQALAAYAERSELQLKLSSPSRLPVLTNPKQNGGFEHAPSYTTFVRD